MDIIRLAFAVHAICLSLLLLLLLPTGVHAQNTSPSNDTSQIQNGVGFLMSTTLNNMASSIKIAPLTNNAGLAGTPEQLQAINPSGPLYLANGNTVNQLKPGDIAYISCEPSDYPGEIDAPRTINLAVNNRPAAIVLFTEYAASCSFTPTGEFQYTTMYTTEDANSSLAVLTGLNAASPPNPNTSIHVDPNSINGTSNGGGGGSVLGRSPTTAVAMIILYSITGIITTLFLIIIIVGAIRAHRHPERYGPRRIVGRQRQSRAKGIARAMLETLPIVKFGDLEEENKPAEHRTDVELGVTNPEHVENRAASTTEPTDHAEGSHTETGEGPGSAEDVTTEAAPVPIAENAVETGTPAVDNGLACSVCVEDFEKGQDVRVLPCKHRFHPDCIDPWLLNVSGTCPLCRTDLRPTASHGDEEDVSAPPATTSLEDANSTAAFNESTRRNRRSRILHTLNIGRMRNATPEERIAALRMLRNEQMTGDSTPRARSRFSQRLSRTFGSRPHSGAGTPRRNSGIIATAETSSAAEAHPTTEMESTAEEPSPVEEAPTTDLSHMAEVPPPAEMPHIEEAHKVDAPHAVGSAQTVELVRPSTEIARSKETPPTVDDQINAKEPSTTEAPSTAETAPVDDASPAGASTAAINSNNEVAAPETTHSAALASAQAPGASEGPSAPGPRSEANIAPFYSYR